MEESPLTLADIAEVLSASPSLEGNTRSRLAQWVRTDPRLRPKIDRLHRLADEAGVDPKESSEALAVALAHWNDLEMLLDHRDWEDPVEVLDPDRTGPGDRPIGYAEMIRLAEARALEEEDPSQVLAVKRKLERARDRLEEYHRHMDALVESLLSFEEGMAESLCQMVIRRYRQRREESGRNS